MDARRILYVEDNVLMEAGKPLARQVRRVAGLAVIANPYAGRFADDLSPLFDTGMELGAILMKRVTELLGGAAVSYGKAAIVGTAGEMEHGGALLHPKLGKPMRAAVGGGEAIIPSNVKVAAAGTPIDVPLGHKDDVWSFDHFDTMTVMAPDAPRPDEIVMVVAVADGGRPFPRVGKGRATV
ncbi:MAG: amino acid synthesis family protein [Candidatus Rokuibacteriota bacterium]